MVKINTTHYDRTTYRPEECNCDECPLKHEAFAGKWVPPKYSDLRKPKLIQVSDSPGYQETMFGKVMSGMPGKLNERLLRACGLHLGQVHKTYAALCQIPKRMPPGEVKKVLECCRYRLYKELDSIDPQGSQLIQVMGDNAMKSVVGKFGGFKWCGSELQGVAWETKKERSKKVYSAGQLADFSKWEFFPTLHPGYCLNDPAYTSVLATHMDWCIKLNDGRMKSWEWPEFAIWPGDEMIARLEQLISDNLPIGYDVETNGQDSKNDVLTCIGLANRNTGISTPWEDYLSKGEMVQGIDSYGTAGKKVKELCLQILKSDIPKVYQNGAYDLIWSLHRLGFEPPNYAFDTIVAHAIIAPLHKHELGFLAASYFHAPRWKSWFKATGDLKGLALFVNTPQEDLREYNFKDAYMTVLLGEVLDKLLDGRETMRTEFLKRMKLMVVAKKMHQYGFKVDTKALADHRVNVIQNRDKAMAKLRELVVASLPKNMGDRVFQHMNYNQLYEFAWAGEQARVKVWDKYYKVKKGQAKRTLEEMEKYLERNQKKLIEKGWPTKLEDCLEVKEPNPEADPRILKRKKDIKTEALKKSRSKLYPLYVNDFLKETYREFNPNSDWQLMLLFLELWEVEPTKYSEDTGIPSLDESVLSGLLSEANEVAALGARYLLAYRKWEKLRATYIDGLELDENNILHPIWRIFNVRTGRWSCS